MITLKFFLENYLIEITYIFQIHYQDRTDNFRVKDGIKIMDA